MTSPQQRWNAKHPEITRGAVAAYRKRHPERVKEIQRVSQAKAYLADPEKHKARIKAYTAANKEKVLASQKRSREKRDPIATKRYAAEYYKANADRIKERSKLLGPAWAKANPAKVIARTNRHRAAKLRAMPAWANASAIERIYAEAVALTATAGIPHHVDHIVPLQSKLVCGLHVERNLTALPGTVNQSKGARHWPDMP